MYKLAMILLLSSSISLADSGLLDRIKTPGVLNPNVTQSNLQQTVCASGYTSTIRPSVRYTNKLKFKQLTDSKYVDKHPTHYEFDHFVPLAIGGHPTDERNLWAEPRFGQYNAADKDVVEYGVYRDLCKGKLSLAQAQAIFLGDWRQSLQYYKR